MQLDKTVSSPDLNLKKTLTSGMHVTIYFNQSYDFRLLL